MYPKILAAILFLFSFQVCLAQETGRADPDHRGVKFSHENIETIVYAVLLEHIYYAGTQTGGPDSERGLLPGTFCLRKQSIPPAGIEAIESDPRIAGGAMEDLRLVNGKPADLRDGYDVKGALVVMRGGPDIEKFFASAKKKYPGTLAAISLSRVGISTDRTQAIVYAEYFGEKAKARRILFLLPMKLYFIPGHPDERIEFGKTKIEAIPL